MLYGSFFKDAIFVNADKHHAMAELAKAFHGPMAMAIHALTTLPFILAVAGVVLSYYMYIINPALPAAIKRSVQPIYNLLDNKYYLDWFNENVLARGARALGGLLWENDKKVIDGTLVNGSWKIVRVFSNIARKFQTGYIYHYAFSMIAGVFLLMTYFVWLKP
jgi:NADH-quinone oxidoreductase subunit L